MRTRLFIPAAIAASLSSPFSSPVHAKDPPPREAPSDPPRKKEQGIDPNRTKKPKQPDKPQTAEGNPPARGG